MNTEIIAVLASGQLILVLWQILKEAKQIREKKIADNNEQEKEIKEIQEMLFKLYRDNLEKKILKTYEHIDSNNPSLNEYLMAIQNDMEVYIKAGGNSTVKDLYIRFADYVREQVGERYYLLLLIDGFDMH